MNILAFMQPGTNSRGLYLDILEGLEELGHRLFRFELDPYWSAMRALGELPGGCSSCDRLNSCRTGDQLSGLLLNGTAADPFCERLGGYVA